MTALIDLVADARILLPEPRAFVKRRSSEIQDAYSCGRYDERREWQRFALLIAHHVRYEQSQGPVTLELPAILEISAELARLGV